MAAVTLEHVIKVFRTGRTEVRAVDDLNLSVADQEFLVLVGPSGCGKTTTLRLIAGLDDLSGGTIQIGGEDVRRVAPKDRDIAMVFQNYALYPHMTVFKNMAFGLKMRRVPKVDIKRKVGEVADLLGIEHLLDRKPAALSGGECQRVALGRAIVRRPRVFLFDEPLSNLDAGLRVRMRSEIKLLHKDLQSTIIHVTHDQEEAMTLGDRLAVMVNGVLMQVGAPMDVYERPANRFVAGFIGMPPMNFIDGELTGDTKNYAFAGPAGRWPLPKDALRNPESLMGKPLVMGLRPDSIHTDSEHAASPGATDAESRIALGRMNIKLIEPLGDITNMHVQLADNATIVARIPPRVAHQLGDKVNLFADASRLHFFGPGEFGERLP